MAAAYAATPKRIDALSTCREHGWSLGTVLKAPSWPLGTKTITGVSPMGAQNQVRDDTNGCRTWVKTLPALVEESV